MLATHRGGPGSLPGSMWGLRWTKRHWGRFSPNTSVFPANHSSDFSIIIVTRSWHNRPISGRGAEWTQLESNPHYTNFLILGALYRPILMYLKYFYRYKITILKK
jgi:hypothetical protein